MTPIAVPCGYATEGQGVTPLGAAIDGGFMRDAGLDVTLRKMGDAHAVSEGLRTGEITFGNLAAPGLVEAVGRGAKIVFLAGGVNQQFLVGAPGQTLASVVGEPMGASSPGDLTDFLIEVTTARVTKTPSETRYVGNSRARFKALLNGEIAASPLSPPLAVEAKHAGCAWLYDYAELGLNFAIGGIAASRTTVEEQPELVAQFLGAYLAGQRRYQYDRAFGIAVQAHYGETSDAVAEETYDVTSTGFRRVPDPATDGMRMLVDFWKAKGTLPASFQVEDVVDSTPVLAVCGAMR